MANLLSVDPSTRQMAGSIHHLIGLGQYHQAVQLIELDREKSRAGGISDEFLRLIKAKIGDVGALVSSAPQKGVVKPAKKGVDFSFSVPEELSPQGPLVTMHIPKKHYAKMEYMCSVLQEMGYPKFEFDPEQGQIHTQYSWNYLQVLLRAYRSEYQAEFSEYKDFFSENGRDAWEDKNFRLLNRNAISPASVNGTRIELYMKECRRAATRSVTHLQSLEIPENRLEHWMRRYGLQDDDSLRQMFYHGASKELVQEMGETEKSLAAPLPELERLAGRVQVVANGAVTELHGTPTEKCAYALREQGLLNETDLAVMRAKMRSEIDLMESFVARGEWFQIGQSGGSHSEILRSLLRQAPGLCIGQDHTEPVTYRLLIDHMQEFAKEGVKVLYLEGFPVETFEPMLKAYHEQESLDLPRDLEFALGVKDQAVLEAGPSLFTEIVKAAKKAGIRVAGLETEMTEQIDFLMDVKEVSEETYAEKRAASMNEAAEALVQQGLQMDPNGKFIALMGAAHAVRKHDIPSVSALMGCPSVGAGPLLSQHPISQRFDVMLK